MAEVLAVVGAVASIVDLAGAATKIVKRIYEFQANLGEIPETFDALWIELPVFEATLAMIQKACSSGGIDGGQSKVLDPLIKGCIEQIKLLDGIISGLQPEKDDSQREKFKKAMKSLRKDKTVEKATKTLRNYNQTLVSHCTLASSSSAMAEAQEKRRKDIIRWLSAPDPYINYNGALKARHDDTGQWLIQDERYTQWKNSSSTLWLHGIPGCGKTILTSTVLEDLFKHSKKDAGEAVAFFFFDFNDPRKQASKLMLHSIVSQISSQSVRPSKKLDMLFAACNGTERQPREDELLVVLRDMLESTPRTFLVLDALDECEDRVRAMEIVSQIEEWEAPGLHFLVTSRREHQIELCLREHIDEKDIICLQSHIVDVDIRLYVQQRLAKDPGLHKWQKDAAVKHEIETALMGGAQGMFRWAACQLDSLSKCRNRVMLRKALKSLPATLDETYDRILCAIDENDADYAYRILYWLAFSKRSLRFGEVAETIAISSDRDPAFDRDEVLEDPHEALTMCSSLINITTDETTSATGSPVPDSDVTRIVLSHFSVKEYLISERILAGKAKRFGMSAPVCHNLIAESCLHYLLEIEEPQAGETDWLDRNALAQYSAITWCHHAQMNGDAMAEAVHKLIYSLFTSKVAFENWLRIEKPDDAEVSVGFRRQLSDIPTPIYYACLLGLGRVAKQLIANEGANVNVEGGRFGNPLQAAAISRQETTVKLLIDEGADVNLQGGRHGNALTAACVGGRENIVKLLLERGAKINATGGRYHTALQAASIEGHVPIVKLLLKKGADANIKGGRYGTALQAASIGGWAAIVELLLDEGGADANAVGGRYGSALQAASIEGVEKIVRLLLDHGADPGLEGGRYGSALQAAAIGGHDGLVRMFVNRSVDVNASGGKFGTALQAASKRGNAATVRMLLDRGANANVQATVAYGTPVQEALAGKHSSVVTILETELV